MFAVIRTGGKQYRVAKDDKIVVEKLTGEPGAMVELADVLMIGGDGKAPTVGSPVIDKAAVFAEVVEPDLARWNAPGRFVIAQLLPEYIAHLHLGLDVSAACPNKIRPIPLRQGFWRMDVRHFSVSPPPSQLSIIHSPLYVQSNRNL